MRTRLLKLIGMAAVIVTVLVFLKPTEVAVADQAPTASVTAPAAAPVLKTPWGEPDLQGIWTDESDTPLQRPAKYANQEFFTAAQREELDKERAALLRRDRRVERGTELDVAGAYNAVFMSMKRTGTRTSMIVDPANGRIPQLTPAADKIAAAGRHRDVLRRGPGARLAAQHRDEREPAFARQHPPMVRRLARPLGRQ